MGLEKDCKLNLHSKYEAGPRNLITDVAGVKVGHVTLQSEDHNVNTGVTAILPHSGNLFREKLFAGAAVINGFGKSVGLVQIDELGTLESPIVMTNTLSVGTALTASVKYMLEKNPEIGVQTGTVNCVVTECNDGEINDIRGLHVTEEHVRQALENAENCDGTFEEGAVGSGTGMEMMGLKGGIGSASRMVRIGGRWFTIGALCMTNYGTDDNLVIGGDFIGRRIDAERKKEDKGSCIIIIATDIPLRDRQLRRVALRAAHSLARTGSYSGNGSGDLAIAFSTANKVEHFNESPFATYEFLYDENISRTFEATVECVEEALISSMYHAKHTLGVRGRDEKCLQEYLHLYKG
ncbi:MAG: P1 family peptidase [Clostridia bacterium]|nr:P1 family peptidase [Clostridia bacterium]